MEQQKPVLGILAAGMGSRYGGLKQIDPIGPNGEMIIDYSAYDAKQVGFEQVVILIKEEMQELFEEKIGRRLRNFVDVRYVYQSLDDIPEDAVLPEGRIKPWGTGHAVYSLRKGIDGPFGAINADDFYGRETFQKLYQYLSAARDGEKYDYCMVGFKLQNTLTENGTVSRGVCRVSKDGMLLDVTEHTKIFRNAQGNIVHEDEGQTVRLSPDAIVSLNVWGFTPSFFAELAKGFADFMQNGDGDLIKKEYFLPSAVDLLIKQGKAEVKVLDTSEKWYGVTYKEDKEQVKKALKVLHDAGVYPVLA